MGKLLNWKARKLRRWSAMAKTFTRLGKDISGVKENGADRKLKITCTDRNARQLICQKIILKSN